MPEKIEIVHESARLSGNWYAPEGETARGVIFSHGLFSTKDGYKITRLAESITAEGFSLITFDFRYSGESGSDISDLSIAGEVEDLAAVVKFARQRGIKELHLMGSSMGAAVTLLFAGRKETDITSIITIAAPVRLLDIVPGMNRERVHSLPGEGKTPIEGILMKNSFFRELEATDIVSPLGSLKVPLLAIHGALDSVVPPRQAVLLEENYGGRIRKVMIDRGDHNLTTERDIEIIRGEVISWLGGNRT